MPWGALIGAGATIGSTLLNRQAASSASKAMQNAQQGTIDFEKGIYNNTQGQLSPYINTGTNALSALSGLFGLGTPAGGSGDAANGASAAFTNFTNLPQYQFALQQGDLGANRALAAAGLTGSGAAVKGLSQYNQGLASQGFGSYIQQLAALAGMGQGAIGTGASTGLGAEQTIAGANTNLGNAAGGGILGSNNALTQGIGSLLNPNTNNTNNPMTNGSVLGSLSSYIGNQVGGIVNSGTASYPDGTPYSPVPRGQ